MRKTGGASPVDTDEDGPSSVVAPLPSAAEPDGPSCSLPDSVRSSQNLTFRKKASVWLLSCAVASPSFLYRLAIIVSPRGDRTKKLDIMLLLLVPLLLIPFNTNTKNNICQCVVVLFWEDMNYLNAVLNVLF